MECVIDDCCGLCVFDQFFSDISCHATRLSVMQAMLLLHCFVTWLVPRMHINYAQQNLKKAPSYAEKYSHFADFVNTLLYSTADSDVIIFDEWQWWITSESSTFGDENDYHGQLCCSITLFQNQNVEIFWKIIRELQLLSRLENQAFPLLHNCIVRSYWERSPFDIYTMGYLNINMYERIYILMPCWSSMNIFLVNILRAAETKRSRYCHWLNVSSPSY